MPLGLRYLKSLIMIHKRRKFQEGFISQEVAKDNECGKPQEDT